MPEFLKPHTESGRQGTILTVKVQPRSSRSGPIGTLGEALRWGVHAPPAENKANEELVKGIAAFFKLPQSRVTLLRGATSRAKVVFLEGVAPEEAASRLDLG